MKIIDRIILTVCSLSLMLLSIGLMVFPFEQLGLISLNDVNSIFRYIQGNYLFSIIGLVFLLASSKLLELGLFGHRGRSKGKYLRQVTEYGHISISSETIIGLVESVSDKFIGVSNIKTRVDILESQIYVSLKGEVSPEIDIRKTTVELQSKIKDHVENCTGVTVNEIKVEITNVTAPIRSLK